MATGGVSVCLKLFLDRRDLFQNLLDLSKRQHELIEQEKFSELFELLSCKQQILNRLDVLSTGQQPVWHSWREDRDQLDPAIRADCEAALAETEGILKQLLNAEGESTNLLVRRRDDTRRQLEAIAQGNRVHEAYRDSLAPATHRRLDVDQ